MSRKVLITVLAVLVTVVPASAQEEGAAPALDNRMAYLSRLLDGNLVRHKTIRDYMTPLFQGTDGRDRFLLNLVALARQAKIIDARIRRVDWNLQELDPVYGYAVADMKICGWWHMWIPRCADLETRWRVEDGQWYLMPPEKIELDPRTNRFLRRLRRDAD